MSPEPVQYIEPPVPLCASALPLQVSLVAHEVMGCVQVPAPSHWSVVQVWVSGVQGEPAGRLDQATRLIAPRHAWQMFDGLTVPSA